MKILFVFSGNANESEFSLEKDHSILYDFICSLEKEGIKIDCFLIKEKGIRGYLRNIITLRKALKKEKYDLIHAFYGLSGLLSVFQNFIPVIVTFTGSDITDKKNRFFSKIALKFSAYNIFVSDNLVKLARPAKKYTILPFGVNVSETFIPLDKNICRQKIGWDLNKKYVLFTSSFSNPVKNYPLAKEALREKNDFELMELKKRMPREDMKYYINAADFLLMTSFSEGSPQVIKEAMACNCPIISTDVGDVKMIFGNTVGYYITSYNSNEIVKKIQEVENFIKIHGKTKGRQRIIELGLDSETIANRMIQIYKKILTEYAA